MKKWMKKLTGMLTAGMLVLNLLALTAGAAEGNQLVQVDLWHATRNQASMGNVATDNNGQALYNPETNTLQVATNPVNVSGYMSAITKVQYDATGKGSYTDVKVLSNGTVETGTKNDGTNHTVTYVSSFEFPVPSYITREGVEYIPLQMVVPYTPMDEVVGEGYLNSRLRIDWDQVQSTALTQIQPDDTMSSGDVESVDRVDQASGIRLVTDSAKVSSDTTFQVTTVTSGSAYDLAKKALTGVSGSFTLYNIQLITAAGTSTDPFGAITLYFPYSGEPNLYRVNDTGTKTVLRGAASDEGYEIMTTKVGLFAVFGGTKMKVTTTPSTSNTPTTPSTSTTTDSNAAAEFTDISNHWAKDSITRAVNAGLFNGTSTTTFSPERTMTSAMVVTVLYRIAGSPAVSLPDSLENVTPGVWHEIASAWGYEKGVIGGYKTYTPDEPVSRQELAAMLHKFYSLSKTPVPGADLSSFMDVSSVFSWAREGVAWANAAGIVGGTSSTTLSPTSSATRAQVATMLCRYLDYAK